MPLKLYSIFHLNLAYSSIAEAKRPLVIKRCYWPLLELVGSLGIPIGIELSGYTLEQINLIDRSWIKKAHCLLQQKKIEIIGSGYSQIIGPLVPAQVNEYNQLIGISVYKKIFGYSPELALVNEQAYSSGLIVHYRKAGYKAIIMEWDNPYHSHQEWDKRWRYYPQKVSDSEGNSVPLIWNNAISFQKFQRYAQGEMQLGEYMVYLESHISRDESVFPLYGNDAEVFDFRPGRFDTEARIHQDGEWNRIRILFQKLKENKNFSLILPSQTLKYLGHPLAGNLLHLESCGQPIPVKKQEKYNITRWAVTGPDDTRINTKCYQIYSYLRNMKSKQANRATKDKLWKDLCFFWSSDFRTHIEKKRWNEFKRVLDSAAKPAQKNSNSRIVKGFPEINSKGIIKPKIEYEDAKIIMESKKNRLVLNCNKGLAVDSLIFKGVYPRLLIGTIPHGYYDDITFSADYFTGHTIIEESGKKKVTDLSIAKPSLFKVYKKGYISVVCTVKTKVGTIKKEIRFYISEPRLDFYYYFDIKLDMPGSVRTGIITLLPESFNRKNLYYKTINGGYQPELFKFNDDNVSHSQPVDRLISASHCLGATEGWTEIGDKDKYIKIQTDKSQMYSVPMIEYENVVPSYFLRCLHSINEADETSITNKKIKGTIGFSITGHIAK